MTRDDLVQRLVDLQREIGSTANGAHCYGVWARRIGEIIAALATPPAAPRVPDTPQGWPDANNAVRWESREPQCVIGVYCQRHGWVHGQEAEELREHLEALSLPAVNRVLDAVDARDSLAYLEATNEPTPPDVAPPQEPPR